MQCLITTVILNSAELQFNSDLYQDMYRNMTLLPIHSSSGKSVIPGEFYSKY